MTDTAIKCPDCKEIYDTQYELDTHECPVRVDEEGEVVSGVADSVSDMDRIEDELVQAASAPSLATLFKRAKKSGLIQAGKEYGST